MPEGVRIQGRDTDSFTLGVALPGGADGLWLIWCPQHPTDHLFKIVVTQTEDADETSDLYCPYCGHHETEVWPFAPDKRARLDAAAEGARLNGGINFWRQVGVQRWPWPCPQPARVDGPTQARTPARRPVIRTHDGVP